MASCYYLTSCGSICLVWLECMKFSRSVSMQLLGMPTWHKHRFKVEVLIINVIQNHVETAAKSMEQNTCMLWSEIATDETAATTA